MIFKGINMSNLIKASRDSHIAEFVQIQSNFGDQYIAIIGKNNHFIFDSIDQNSNSTPLVLTSINQPIYLGTFAKFIKTNALEKPLTLLCEYLKNHFPEKENDSLFIVRVLHWLMQQKFESKYNDKSFKLAINEIFMLEKKIDGLHCFVKDIEKNNT
jgi:hypothetical protein